VAPPFVRRMGSKEMVEKPDVSILKLQTQKIQRIHNTYVEGGGGARRCPSYQDVLRVDPARVQSEVKSSKFLTRLSATAYSVCSQLTSKYLGRLLHLYTEDAPCHGDKGPINTAIDKLYTE
jgi:hypothetical protein